MLPPVSHPYNRVGGTFLRSATSHPDRQHDAYRARPRCGPGGSIPRALARCSRGSVRRSIASGALASAPTPSMRETRFPGEGSMPSAGRKGMPVSTTQRAGAAETTRWPGRPSPGPGCRQRHRRGQPPGRGSSRHRRVLCLPRRPEDGTGRRSPLGPILQGRSLHPLSPKTTARRRRESNPGTGLCRPRTAPTNYLVSR